MTMPAVDASSNASRRSSLDHPLDQVDGKPAADDRSCCESLVGLDRKPGKPAAHCFSNALRQGARVPPAITFVDVAQRLDEEERIAAGDGCQGSGQVFVVIAGLGDVSGDVVLVETAERKTMC